GDDGVVVMMNAAGGGVMAGEHGCGGVGCNGGVRLAAGGDGGDGGVVETMVMLMVAVEMGLRR
ncbi:hypothetical protein Tco_0177664, partial [Tanacetum coccineum]